MVKFSCFLASLHHHKSKKYPLQTPEAMQKTSQDQTHEYEGNGLGKSPISDTSNLQPMRSDRNSLITHSTSCDALVPVDNGTSSVSEERQECFSEPDPWLGTICLKRSKSLCAGLDNGNGFSTVVDLENEAEKALSCIDIQERVSDDHKDYANASPGILSGMDDDDSGKHPLNRGVLAHEDLYPSLERANSFPNLIENARSEASSPLAEDVLVFGPRSKSSSNLQDLFRNKQALLDNDAGVGNSSFLNVSAPLSLKSEQLHEVIAEGSVFSHRNGGTTTQVFDEVSISIQEAAIGDGAADGYDSCGSSVHEHEIVESHPVGIEDMDNLHSVYQEADGLKEYPRHWWEGLSSKEFHHKRIENWISTISDDESKVEDFAPQETGQASTSSSRLRSDVNEVGGGPAAVKADPKAHQSTELARRHLSMLGPMSTIAQMSNCSLASIPQLGIFSGLRMVNLSGNAIARITPGVLPKGLRVLNLSRNNISIIEGLRDLTRLRVLDLSYNRIVRIGHGLASCSSLKELYLAGNKISEVEGLHRLLKLNILDIGYNKISTTKCLGQLAANYGSLQAINLEGNPAQKNVGDEQLKKALLSLLPHLIYINRRPVKAGSFKDLVPDRAARTASSSHQFERGVRSDRKVSRKGSHGGSGGHKSSSVSNSYNQATNKHSRSHYLQDGVNRSKVTLHQANLENRLVDLHLVKSQRNKSEGSLNKIV